MKLFKKDIRNGRAKSHFIDKGIPMHCTLTSSYGSEPVRSPAAERLSVCLANRNMGTHMRAAPV